MSATTLRLWWPPALSYFPASSALLITNDGFLLAPLLESWVAVSGIASSQIQTFLCLYSSRAAICPMKFQCCPGGSRRKSWEKTVLTLLVLNHILVQSFSYRTSLDLLLPYLFTVYARGKAKCTMSLGRSWEETQHISLPRVLHFQMLKYKNSLSTGEALQCLQCYLCSDEFLWNRKKHDLNTNNTATGIFSI